MSSESPAAVLFDFNGNELAVQNGVATPASTPALMFAGSDGTNSRYITIDTSGRVILVGAGVAGTPAGGVLSIQGVASGTAVPVSGTVSISGTVGVTQSTSPWVDNITQFGGNNVVTGTGASGLGIPRVTVSNDSNVLVTQSTSPWVTNITQFGNNNVVTGTGTSGSGIPRVTVSNDSNILATQSGTWTVIATQATAANLRAQTASESTTATATGTVAALMGGAVTTASPTYTTGQMDPLSLTTAGALRIDGSAVIQPVSGTVTANQGTANTLANAWPTEITDGTHGPAAVKAASTAPVAADPALVTVISPNQQAIPVAAAPASATVGVSFGRGVGSAGTALAPLRATTYTEQTTNFTGSVKSSSANDASAGTGARTVIITYYDQTGAGPNTETVTLNGTTAVNLVNTNHCFIEKMVVATVGTGASNAGTISLFTGAGGTGTTVGSIGVNNASGSRGDNTTLWAHHYTPTGKTSSIYLINAGTTGNQNADISLYSIPVLTANAAEIKISDSIIVGANSDSISRSSPNPIKVSGFARTTMYAVANGANTNFAGGFDYADQ